jgi:hypothetical protein
MVEPLIFSVLTCSKIHYRGFDIAFGRRAQSIGSGSETIFDISSPPGVSVGLQTII